VPNGEQLFLLALLSEFKRGAANKQRVAVGFQKNDAVV
jgi:hypothetical protein